MPDTTSIIEDPGFAYAYARPATMPPPRYDDTYMDVRASEETTTQTVGTHPRPNLEDWEKDFEEGTPFVTTKSGARYYETTMEEAEYLEECLKEIEDGTAEFVTQEEMEQEWAEDRKRLNAKIQQMETVE